MARTVHSCEHAVQAWGKGKGRHEQAEVKARVYTSGWREGGYKWEYAKMSA